jgi:hypothetical protein
MKINESKPGDKFQIRLQNVQGQAVDVKFEIIEVSWYPSPVKEGCFYHGAKVRFEDSEETVLDFIALECSDKVI